MDVAPVGVEHEVPLRLVAQVEAEEAEVYIQQPLKLAGKRGLELIPVLMGKVGELYFKVRVGLGRGDVKPRLDEVVLHRVHDLLRDEHHPRHRLTDDAVERDEDGEGDKGPQTAGHGVRAVFLVQLLHLLIELLGVALMPALELLHLGLEARGAHHAFLALSHEGRQDKVDDKGEEYDGYAVIAGQLIELDHKPCEGLSDCCPHRFLLKCVLFVFQGTGS